MSAQAIQLAAHLPVLQVVVPLLSAPVCALMYRPRIAWATALAVSAMALVMAIALLDRVLETGPFPMRSVVGPRPGASSTASIR